MNSDRYVAILFCEEGRISREMMYVEFEAILDSFVPLPEYAGEEVQAIYVEISPQLKVEAAVYFLLGFDGAGNADRKWNIPLEQLAEQGELGPNLGGGAIRLACRSQCSVSWHTQNLWDPDMSKDPNDFVLLRDVVKRNKLAFKQFAEEPIEEAPELISVPAPVVRAEPESTVTSVANLAPEPTPENLLSALVGENASESDKTLSASLVQFLRQKIDDEHTTERDELNKQQTLLLAAQKTKFDDEINHLEDQHSDELRQMQESLQEYSSSLDGYKKQTQNLEAQLEERSLLLEKSQKSFEQELAKTKEADGNQIDILKNSLEQEMQRKLELLAKEHDDEASSKNMEIAYRDEEVSSLKNEVDNLKEERVVLISQGGEQFLNRLKENQVSFMAYHQGAGNINIEIDDIGGYLSSPISYVAESCKVDENIYKQWLEHHDTPVCQSHSELKGKVCGKKLKEVTSPSQFVPGRSDRCPLHWSFS